MQFVAVVGARLALARRHRCVRIGRLSLAIDRGRTMPRLDQRGIDHRAALQQKPARLQLALELAKQPLAQPCFDQPVAETAQGGVVRAGCSQRQPHELAKRHAIVDCLLQIRVGKPVPLLQQKRLQHHQWLERRSPGTIRLQLRKQLLEPVPIHFSTKPLQNNTLADLRRNPAVPKAKLSAHPIASKQRRLNHKLSILQRSPQGGGRHPRRDPHLRRSGSRSLDRRTPTSTS